jgi:general secretion pathway protein B
MSFILDALKKSETDRQQQSSAEFAGIPTSPKAPSIPRWLWGLGILLAVNLAVLVGLLLKPDTDPVTTSPPVAERPLALEEASQPSFAERAAVARQNPPETQIASGEPQLPQQESVRPVLISQDPSSIPSSEIYPSLQEVRVSGSIDLPDLHLDIHVFSEEPEDRFVFINMSKLREGSRLEEGPVVSEITPDGVVLRHLGQSFLLPRD